MRHTTTAQSRVACFGMRWLAVSILAAACGSSNSPAAGLATRTSACHETKLAELDRTLTAARADDRAKLAAAGIATACPAFEPPLRDALHTFAFGSDAEAQRALQQALEQHVDLWNASCAGGISVLSSQAALVGSDSVRAMWTGCAVERFDIATANDWLRARNTVLAVFAHGSLVAAGVAPERVRAYTRALAEL